jgi:hypothetical protein
MPSISPVSLRALLVALQRLGLRRLGQMHLAADTLQLLDHEPPARRRLQRDLQALALELLDELLHPDSVRWHHPRTRDLTGDRVDPLRRDLRAMLIKPHHDRHQTTSSPVITTTRANVPAAHPAAHRIP